MGLKPLFVRSHLDSACLLKERALLGESSVSPTHSSHPAENAVRSPFSFRVGEVLLVWTPLRLACQGLQIRRDDFRPSHKVLKVLCFVLFFG